MGIMRQKWNQKSSNYGIQMVNPNGTIPIRRTSAIDILRFSKFGKKTSTQFKADPAHEHAIGYLNGEYYGGQGIFNVWSPNVTNEEETSLAQIWVISDIPDHDSNSVEAGWMVYQQLRGDNFTRLFTYWTNDSYRQSGCFNLLCPGFVQTSNQLSLGASISPTSEYDGPQFEFTILIWKDIRTGDWWLRVQNIIMGYWPSILFPDLGDKATSVQFGGEVYSSQASGEPHTSTPMGSGHFPGEGFGRASFIKYIELVDGENKYLPIPGRSLYISLYADQPNCYDVINGYSDAWGSYIFFGGSGFNPNCP